jgi:hypothetical protein
MTTDVVHVKNKIYDLHSNLYYSIAKLLSRPNLSEDFNYFHKYSYLKINQYLKKSIVLKLINEFNCSKKAKESDLVKINNIFLRRLFNLSRNSLFYYDFPSQILNDYEYCLDPLVNMPSLKYFVSKRIIKTASYFMNSKVVIECSDVYKTKKNINKKHENANWHLDGDFSESFKILIYLTDVNKKTGGALCVEDAKGIRRILYGKAGTAIIFKASKIIHSGSSPKSDRLCLNFNIYPSIFKSCITRYKKINYTSRFFYFLPSF